MSYIDREETIKALKPMAGVGNRVLDRIKDLPPADVIPIEWIQEQIREQNFDTRVLSRMLRAWRAEQNEKD